jgi:hypothetical protein
MRNLEPLPSELANPRLDNRMKNRFSLVPENFNASLYMNQQLPMQKEKSLENYYHSAKTMEVCDQLRKIRREMNFHKHDGINMGYGM